MFYVIEYMCIKNNQTRKRKFYLNKGNFVFSKCIILLKGFYNAPLLNFSEKICFSLKLLQKKRI